MKDVLLNIRKVSLDSLQFACRTGRVVDDAISALLNTILAHLKGAKTCVWFVLIDFSSAFNCMHSHISAERLGCIHDPGWLLADGFFN